ncbi:hypothetical protein [Mesorhizobium sp.]|uniref:hypothetical protein n=1 Tax=Mesorhizobium sp. TaxID=1871066 RepID=UPI000FE43595|nr:hypothetical protein [Mesorhizobium sp.]RWK39222.1 MAG: hypothetical protein EOR40_04210 [Mesorhizobium sp.]
MEKPLFSSFSLDPTALEIAVDAGDEYCQHTAKPPRLAYAAAIRAYLREMAALELASQAQELDMGYGDNHG